jgi:hypothetical protein
VHQKLSTGIEQVRAIVGTSSARRERGDFPYPYRSGPLIRNDRAPAVAYPPREFGGWNYGSEAAIQRHKDWIDRMKTKVMQATRRQLAKTIPTSALPFANREVSTGYF